MTLKTIIDQSFKKKTQVHACFIDFKKAFDLVNRKALFHKLRKYGVQGDFFNTLQDMYARVDFSVKLPQVRTPYFNTSVGVNQ